MTASSAEHQISNYRNIVMPLNPLLTKGTMRTRTKHRELQWNTVNADIDKTTNEKAQHNDECSIHRGSHIFKSQQPLFVQPIPHFARTLTDVYKAIYTVASLNVIPQSSESFRVDHNKATAYSLALVENCSETALIHRSMLLSD